MNFLNIFWIVRVIKSFPERFLSFLNFNISSICIYSLNIFKDSILRIFKLYTALPFESAGDVEQHISQEILRKHYLDGRYVFYHKMDPSITSFLIFGLYTFLIPSTWKLIDQRLHEQLRPTHKNKLSIFSNVLLC